jgi:hypothetical protein
MPSPANKISDLSISYNYIRIYKKIKYFGLNFREIKLYWGDGVLGELGYWGNGEMGNGGDRKLGRWEDKKLRS